MFKRNLTALAAGAMLAIGATSVYALAPSVSGDVAREAAEGPRGADNERPGDRQRRGGRGLIEVPGDNIIAREASEGPRGADNERPGDRQRRGGRG